MQKHRIEESTALHQGKTSYIPSRQTELVLVMVLMLVCARVRARVCVCVCVCVCGGGVISLILSQKNRFFAAKNYVSCLNPLSPPPPPNVMISDPYMIELRVYL